MAQNRRRPSQVDHQPPPTHPPGIPQDADPRPCAAYVLGHHSRTLRLWETLFWQVNADLSGSDEGVPVALEELREALLALAAVIPANVYQELARVLDGIAALHDRLVRDWETNRRHQSRPFGQGHAPGGRAWRQLLLLADQALAPTNPLQPWYQLGVAVGLCRLTLLEEEPHERKADFLAVARAAQAVPTPQRLHVPALVDLADLAGDPHPVDEPTLLRNFVERQEDLWHYQGLDPVEHRWTLDSLLIALDRQIQADLSHLSQGPTPPPDGLKPSWDKEHHELRVGDVVVRKVRPIAKHIIRILDSFQELGWPPRIDDPIPGPDHSQWSRMHEAIDSLNQSLTLLRFHGDGTGKGIAWEWL